MLQTSTIIARTPAALLSRLSRLSKSYTENPLLFTLSANIDPNNLSTLVSRLTSISSESIGCLSAPRCIPGSTESLITCSLAAFNRHHCKTFRSTIAGRQAAQVGRWHAFRKRGDVDVMPPSVESEHVDWEEVWGRSTTSTVLPTELQHVEPGDLSTVIYLSDAAPEGLANALANFPLATKLGLIAASTPFITGRPVTLFHNNKIYSSGAVGIALTAKENPRSHIEFPGLRAISGRLTVTRSNGNLINEVNNSNPAQLLLTAIRSHGLDITHKSQLQDAFKDDEQFYIGVLQDDKLCQVYHIISGDPSRGTIALQSHAAPRETTQVQFFHLPKIPASLEVQKQYLEDLPTHSRTRSLSFATPSQPSPTSRPITRSQDGIVCELSGLFLAASENGFVVSRGMGGDKIDKDAEDGKRDEAEIAWRCMVPGAKATLEWA